MFHNLKTICVFKKRNAVGILGLYRVYSLAYYYHTIVPTLYL